MLFGCCHCRHRSSSNVFDLPSPTLPTNSNHMLRNHFWGLPWWRSGWESACPCGGRGFRPRSGRIPQAVERLGPCATATEPACRSCWGPHAWSPCSARKTVAPARHSWRGPVCSGEDPTQPKINKF